MMNFDQETVLTGQVESASVCQTEAVFDEPKTARDCPVQVRETPLERRRRLRW
jgi:hypothetical protein